MIVPDLTVDEIVAIFAVVDAARRGTTAEHLGALNALNRVAAYRAERIVLLCEVATRVRLALNDLEIAPIAPPRERAPGRSA